MIQALGIALMAGGALLVFSGARDEAPSELIRGAFDSARPGRAAGGFAGLFSQTGTIAGAAAGTRPGSRPGGSAGAAAGGRRDA